MLPSDQPHPVIENPQTLRPAGPLAGAGAWDAAPAEFAVAGFDRLTIYASYTRAGAGGAVDVQAQGSPYAANRAGVENWFEQSLLAPAVLAAGVDAQSRVQREYVTYQATGAGVENFVPGVLRVSGLERIRIRCRESGAVPTPGAAHLVGVLSVGA